MIATVMVTCLVGMTGTCTVMPPSGLLPPHPERYVTCLAYHRLRGTNPLDPLDYYLETADSCHIGQHSVTIRGKANTRYTIKLQIYDVPLR